MTAFEYVPTCVYTYETACKVCRTLTQLFFMPVLSIGEMRAVLLELGYYEKVRIET